MMKNNERQKRPIIIAAVAASLVMLAYGTSYRFLTARLSAPVDVVSLSPDALAQLPLQLGNWSGQPKPLDRTIIEATDTDQHISRTYSRRNPPGLVWLYIAYGVRPRDLAPHRPEVCYTTAGRALIGRSFKQYELHNGTQLPCSVLHFSPNELSNEGILVLNYYIVDDQCYRDVSVLRKRGWRGLLGLRGIDHVAQVQIVTSIGPDQHADAAESSVRGFAIESASSIYDLFRTANAGACSDGSLLHEGKTSGENK